MIFKRPDFYTYIKSLGVNMKADMYKGVVAHGVSC